MAKGFCRIPYPTKRQQRIEKRRALKKHHKGVFELTHRLSNPSVSFFECPGRRLEFQLLKMRKRSVWDSFNFRNCNRHFEEKTLQPTGSIHLVENSQICYATSNAAERFQKWKQSRKGLK
jgi:predicted metal-binding protein